MPLSSVRVFSSFLERKTGLEPATYSLEGYRSTKWATSAYLVLLSWGRVDSNHRTLPRTDLQSVAIAAMRLPLRSSQLLSRVASRWRDSNPRPRDYKSRALANWATSAGYNSSFQITHSRLSRLQRYNFFLYPQTFFYLFSMPFY